MGNKKDSISNGIAHKFLDFSKQSIFYEEIIEVIRESKEPTNFNSSLELLEKCLIAYYDILEDNLNGSDFSIIHDAALRIISSDDETYTSKSYENIFLDIRTAVIEGEKNGFLDFSDIEAIRLLKVLKNDYLLVLFKLFLLEPYVKNRGCHGFADLLTRYTALIAFDASQCAIFYNSKEYKEQMHKLLSIESGETSQSDNVHEKRKALIEEITTAAIKLIDTDDSKSLDDRAKEIPKIVDALVVNINTRTALEIDTALKKEFPRWETNANHEEKVRIGNEKQVDELKISSRRARKVVRDEWGRRHAANIEN